jgi:hypothetical protein
VSYDEIALRSEIDAKPSLLLYRRAVAANPSAAGAMPVITSEGRMRARGVLRLGFAERRVELLATGGCAGL